MWTSCMSLMSQFFHHSRPTCSVLLGKGLSQFSDGSISQQE
ncbi:hypothetical protein CGRA01v4_02873 [Colletotrichum graminicola]|nr:hypothetical protein CGRA01v4_02873 [Colletotrichum graminicola]